MTDRQQDTPKEMHRPTRGPAIIVGIVAVAVAALSLFYLLRPEPLLVQGEADATRLDIAARVDGRVKQIPVERGQNVAAGAVLVTIDNPETVAKLAQMKAAKAVAEAQNANVLAGTRVESIAARKAEMERTQASLVLAQKTFDRTNILTQQGNAPQSRLDQATDALHESERAVDQATNRPMSRRSTATPRKSGRSPRPTSRRPMPISRAFNRSSTSSWSMRRSPRRSTSAMSSPANMSRPACRW